LRIADNEAQETPLREQSQTWKEGMDEKPRRDASEKGGQTSRTEDNHPDERVVSAESGGPYMKDRDTEMAVEAGRKGHWQNASDNTSHLLSARKRR